MYILPKCQNPTCLYHEKHEPSMLIKKGKDNRKNGKPVQRYQCKACGQQFTSASLTDNPFHKPELLKEIFLRYTSGYSVSRLSQELGICKNTVLSMIEYLADKCRTYHFDLLDSGFLTTDKIHFDEMETFEHSKVYPVSVGIAYDARYKRIIDMRVAEIKLKGALKKKVIADCNGVLPVKIASRPNNSPMMLVELMKSVKKSLIPSGFLFSDDKPAYITVVATCLPPTVRFVQELSKINLKDSKDRQGLGRFRSVCAYLRTYTGTMGRRKLNTAKTMKSLSEHFYLMIARYNKYDLNEILKHGIVQGDFYEDEWTKRKQLKALKQFIAVITYPQFLKKQQRIQKLKATWQKKKAQLAVSKPKKVA